MAAGLAFYCAGLLTYRAFFIIINTVCTENGGQLSIYKAEWRLWKQNAILP